MNSQSKSILIIRWLAVAPGSVIAALLVLFPVHWGVLLIEYFGTEIDDDGMVIVTNPIAAIPPDTLEYLANGFITPFVVVAGAAYIAPNRKTKTSAVP